MVGALSNASFPVSAGPLCENTLPALISLIRRDNAGELPSGSLAYVEFDIHVSMRIPERSHVTKLKCTMRGLSLTKQAQKEHCHPALC